MTIKLTIFICELQTNIMFITKKDWEASVKCIKLFIIFQYRYGDRIPAVFFHPQSKRLHICSAVNDNVNHCFSDTKDLTTRRYTRVRISQLRDRRGQYVYNIYINGVVRHTTVNTRPTTFYNVKYYLGDPWHPAARARVRNVEIKISSSGKEIFL